MKNLTVVKVGGKIVESEKSLNAFLDRFVAIKGAKLLVHGGGRSATTIGEKLGIHSNYVDGRRITDADTIDVVTMVYGGLVNKKIVAGLQARGLNACGFTGADMNMIRAEKRPVVDIDYGFVGDVKSVDGNLLAKIIRMDIVPVMAPLTHDGNGLILNTNADTIASEVAKALTANFSVNLTFCFEREGVLMNENIEDSVIPLINKESFETYKSKGFITGGMIPKLDNAFAAIDAGVKKVIITKDTHLGTKKGTLIQ